MLTLLLEIKVSIFYFQFSIFYFLFSTFYFLLSTFYFLFFISIFYFLFSIFSLDSLGRKAKCHCVQKWQSQQCCILAYERESRESIQRESTRLRQDQESLKPFAFSLDPPVTVHYKGFLTMIDGKILQVGNDSFSAKKWKHKFAKKLSIDLN